LFDDDDDDDDEEEQCSDEEEGMSADERGDRDGMSHEQLRNALGSWMIETKTPLRQGRRLLQILRTADP